MPKQKTIIIDAPARIHLGFGSEGKTLATNLGVAVDFARLKLKISLDTSDKNTSDKIIAPSEYSHTIETHIKNWKNWQRLSKPIEPTNNSNFKVEIVEPPSLPPHSGLGSGTQLAMSLAYGFAKLANIDNFDVVAAVKKMGRMKRSIIGANGWLGGGFIIGNNRNFTRYTLPEGWRIVLLLDQKTQGLFGKSETEAFGKTAAIAQNDFKAFAHIISKVQRAMGEAFKLWQHHNMFMSPAIKSIAHLLPKEGIGQSSWGPTAFVFVPNKAEATRLQAKIQNATTKINVAIVAPDNKGAVITT